MSQTVLEKHRCQAMSEDGHRCKRNTIKYADYCFQHSRRIGGIDIHRSTIPQANKGLYAHRDLPRNTRFRYGRFPQDALTHHELQQKYPGQEHIQYGLCDTAGRWCMDGCSTQSGWARYANDPRGTHRQPNAELSVVRRQGRTIGNLILTRPVKAGQEILVRYGRSYWRHHP